MTFYEKHKHLYHTVKRTATPHDNFRGVMFCLQYSVTVMINTVTNPRAWDLVFQTQLACFMQTTLVWCIPLCSARSFIA